MLVLHHLENSRSQRIAWALEALGLEYAVETYQRTPDKEAPATLKRVHPLGHAPILVDGEITLAESGAILEYLAEVYDDKQVLKPESSDREAILRYRYWLHFAEGSFMSLLIIMMLFHNIPKQPMPFFVRPVAKAISDKVLKKFVDPRLKDMLSFIEDHLSQHHWFAGASVSGADIQMSFPIVALSQSMDLSNYPALCRWLAQVRKEPAYERATAKVGEFTSL